METETVERRRQQTEAARIASAKSFAKRRAEKAIAELESQGYIVIAPERS